MNKDLPTDCLLSEWNLVISPPPFVFASRESESAPDDDTLLLFVSNMINITTPVMELTHVHRALICCDERLFLSARVPRRCEESWTPAVRSQLPRGMGR